MRRTRRLAVVLLAVGALAVVSSSGAFESMTADRAISVGVAEDQNAMISLSYGESTPAEPVVNLESDDADSGNCIWIICWDYRYETVEFLTITDGSSSVEMEVDNVSYQTNNSWMVEEIYVENPSTSLRRLTGDFRCENSQRTQQADTALVAVTIESSSVDDTVSVDIEREIVVNCVAG